MVLSSQRPDLGVKHCMSESDVVYEDHRSRIILSIPENLSVNG
jgi:hypothetical protein